MELESSLNSHFLNLYHMALSDAEIDTTELVVLYSIGEEKGISKEEIDRVILTADKVKFYPPETVFEKIESLYDFARIAWADGKVDENEKRVMKMFCQKFGFKEENVDDILEFLLGEAEKGTPKRELIEKVKDLV